MYFKYKGTDGLKVKKWKTRYLITKITKKTEVAILSSVKIDFRVESFIMLLVVYIEGGRE